MAKHLIFPSNLVNKDLNPAYIGFQYYRNDLGALFPETNIALMMPEAISQPSTVSWDNEKFGVAGELMRQGIRKFIGSDTESQSIDSMTESVKARVGNAAIFNAGGAANQALGGGASAEGLMGSIAGKIPNPYVTAIFRGVNFRNFDFVFRFTPMSEADCVLIDQIITEMRRLSLPSYETNGAYLSYPYECMIDYYWKGKRNKWLNRFKKAACTKIDVNYTGTGSFTTLRNGFPSQIVVTTSWSELELVVRQDVDTGH